MIEEREACLRVMLLKSKERLLNKEKKNGRRGMLEGGVGR